MTARKDSTLVLKDVSLRFAGVQALDGVDLRVEPRTIHSLIGPNGAGKTSCFNVISGVYKPTRGSITLGDAELVGRLPHQIAALGVGRAFQNIALSARQTVAQNLLLGRHVLTSSGLLSAGLRLRRSRQERAAGDEVVARIAGLLGLERHLHRSAGDLSYGDRKRLELGRALAMEPSIVLLDEPVAGMNDDETARTAEILRRVCADLGTAILLIEHDMSLVMGISDHVTVLTSGRYLTSGTPAAVAADPAVQTAYTGAVHAGHESGEAL
ncbi:ABC transporter ATP-binding protein [Dactylosporangium sp. CA-092794]|uniref:ABC transporter ATP-binding protein n=1 Tax=Dactylosporangium sp. CA-092794 TaxID=3239929 RepID=UPI003D91CA3F